MKLFTRKILLFLLLSVPCFSVSGQVTANFTASEIAGCSPILVYFTNTSSPIAGTTFSWDLGLGGTPIPTVNASSSYIIPGTYTITLTATRGGHTSTHSITITVYPSPTVSFIATPRAICPGQSVTFTSTSTPGVPGGMTYLWSFGDGSSGTGSPITHTYAAAGTYNVTLAVTNSDGCTTSLMMPGFITVYATPRPNFIASAYYFCHPPAHVVFSSTTTGASPFTYSWRFGDGSPPSALSGPSHDYTATGTYAVTLIATDSHGCTDSETIPGFITVVNVHASFTGPDTVCVNTMNSFANTSSPHSSSTWDFGDGGMYYSDPGMHSYRTPGIRRILLTISDGSCTDTFSKQIVVLPGPTADFTQNPIHPCPPPIPITFTASVPPGTIVTWLFGDGGTGIGSPITHTYGRRGVDTIKMIARDPRTGCIDTIIHIDTLYDIIQNTTATPRKGCKPLVVTFTTSDFTYEPDTARFPLAPYPWPVTSYSWVFADGAVSTAAAPTHTYTAVGVYHVTVTKTTSNGCTFTDSVLVKVGAPPVITFSATPTHECYHQNQVTFVVTIVSGPADSFTWAFGDGGGGYTLSPGTLHMFSRPGLFSVTVTPYYNGCPGAPVVRTDYILIDSPKSIPYDSVYCSPANWVQFRDFSMGDDTHLWQFGDGVTSTLDNPLHVYPSASVYTATLTTYNVRSGCRDTAFVGIDLRRPIPNFTTPDTAICRDQNVTFTSIITGAGSVSGYRWIEPLGTGELNHSNPTFSDTFHTTGRYTVTLIIMDQNRCLDTVTKINYMLVAKPVSTFTAVPATGCWPLTVTFRDASTDVAGTFFTSYAWDFGDGATSTVTTATTAHTFITAGSFITTEIVTDNVGCIDTAVLSLVTVWRPAASFNASTTTPCRTDSVHFTNGSGTIASSYWEFGDGATSTVYSPWHTYTAPGSYTVKLIVTDSHGCTDTANYVNYINLVQPTASFYMDDSVSICPPLSVNFFNTSIGGLFYNWNLGDGSASTVFSPSDLYISTGYDTVRLIVSNRYGCRDTAYGHVNIFGYAGAFRYLVDSGCVPLLVSFSATTLNVPSINWDFGDGSTSAVSYTDTISHYYVIPGKYIPKLILSNGTGCKNSNIGLDTIKVDAVYPGFKTIPNPVCLGDTFLLADTSTSFFSTITNWSWSIDGNTSTAAAPSFYINGVGTYPATLTVTDGWGCIGTANSSVMIYPPPVITASPDTVICVGDAATLFGYGGVTYTWAPPISLSCTSCNPTLANPPTVTTYTVTGKDAVGCINTDTVMVSLKTKTVSVAHSDTEVCAGTPVQLWDSGATKFNWSPSTGLSNPHIANPIATPGATTKYTIIAQLGSCEADTNYIIIYVHPRPTVDAGPDQTVLEGETAQLNATGTLIKTYLWANEATLSCDSCASPVASMTVSTTYTVTVTSDFGCKDFDTVRIHIYCDKSQIFIPNSFTPNHDGQNDKFYPRGIGIKIVKSFRIYNRWGQLLFERTNISLNDESNAWDGSYLGDVPRPDVYVYVLDAVCETGAPINIKGDVTIIR
jgi:gliding motility-associated-like protein